MNKLFPLEFQKALVNHEMDYARLSKVMMRNGHSMTKAFLWMLGTGSRSCTAETLKKICSDLQCDEMERGKLHLAAARDHGFEI